MVQASKIKQKLYTGAYSLIGMDTVNVTVSDSGLSCEYVNISQRINIINTKSILAQLSLFISPQ
jgi:hypothetical protein